MKKEKTEFWEESFIEKQTMWGFEPSDSAITASELFVKQNVKEVLIPGIGYGRNAKIFHDNGMKVTGIEISQTAINLAKENFGDDFTIYNGSITDMPFDQKLYDGIFCYALIHLLNSNERRKFIRDCFSQLKSGGYMIFVTVSKKFPTYNKGKKLSKERFRTDHAVNLFFYDDESVSREFGKYGLINSVEINEPVKFANNHPAMPFLMITCRKK